MSVTGKTLYKKIQSLRTDLSTGVTPEILDEVCDVSTAQPFLKWFCDNVNCANILSKDELRLKNQLQHTKEWLSGKELDEALEEATYDNPELLKLIYLDDEDMEDAFFEVEALRDLCKMDENYADLLRNSISNLKELEFILDDDIELETNNLEKDQIRMFKAFNDCSIVLEEFDVQHRSFSKDTEQLLNVYSDAAVNKGMPILWTQMPIDLFVKQIRLYNDCLDILVKQEFCSYREEVEKHVNSDYETFADDSKEKQLAEQMRQLASCKLKLTDSKLGDINARLCETSHKAVTEYVNSIYNNGHVKIPEQTRSTDEILDLTRRRDLLEENVTLLRNRQLMEAVERYVETATTKVLQRATRARMERRQIRFDKLKSLLALTRDHGHAHSDLLCMLMDMQFHSLIEISEFIADARHYLATEYSFSSTRCESMRQHQEEYEALRRTVLSYSTFDKLFVSMILGNDITSDALNNALVKFDQLVANNNAKKREIFESYVDKTIDVMLSLEKVLSRCYEDEINSGATASFAPLSFELNVRYDNTFAQLADIRTSLTAIRNTMKERLRSNNGLKREKEILWQRFLADPDTLRKQYEEAKRMADRSHFGNDS